MPWKRYQMFKGHTENIRFPLASSGPLLYNFPFQRWSLSVSCVFSSRYLAYTPWTVWNVTCMCVWKGVFFLFPFLDSGYRFVNTVLLHAFFHFIVYRGGSFVSAPEFFLLLFNTSVGMPVFPGGARGKESTCRSRRCKWHGLDPWVGKIPWSRKWQPTPVSCLESSMGRGTWQATIHGVTKSQTRLSTSGCHDLFNQFPTD